MRLAPFVLLLAACGDGDGAGENAEVTANQIERLSTPAVPAPDPDAAARLEPLGADDVGGASPSGARCSFVSDGRMLLAATGSDALARVRGELRHLVQSTAAGPTGGFFEDRHLSISVGRTGASGTAAGAGAAWPARLTVTNRRSRQQQEIAGIWTCGG